MALSNISGIKINKYCPPITHLFFADDSLIFFKANKEEGASIKKVLQTYELASRQKVNYDKSVCMLSRNINESTERGIIEALEVKQSNSIGQYLGLPAQTGKNKGLMFSRLKE